MNLGSVGPPRKLPITGKKAAGTIVRDTIDAEQKLADAYEPRRILTMTYTPAQGNNSVGQSSVLIKRRSRVQVPVALPILQKDQ